MKGIIKMILILSFILFSLGCFSEEKLVKNSDFSQSTINNKRVESFSIENEQLNRSADKSLLVSELSTNSSSIYKLEEKLKSGSKVYTDKNDEFTKVGSFENLTYIKTSGRDRKRTGTEFISFNINIDTDIYILYDKKANKIPNWLKNFKKTDNIIKSKKQRFRVYKKSFEKGKVKLGGNLNDGSDASCMYLVAFSGETDTEDGKTGNKNTNDDEQWELEKTKSEECYIDFNQVENISQFEDWVIAFRTGGSKDDDNNDGFSLKNINGRQILFATQTDTRDPGGSRRTEAKVAHMKPGDYKVEFDLYIDKFPEGFETTVTQVKCGSGKPPINIKLAPNGGVRVRSAGETVFKDSSRVVFKKGWNKVIFTLEYSKNELSVIINGENIPINNNKVETNPDKISGAGPNYYLKIGLYEDNVKVGYKIGYGNLKLSPM